MHNNTNKTHTRLSAPATPSQEGSRARVYWPYWRVRGRVGLVARVDKVLEPAQRDGHAVERCHDLHQPDQIPEGGGVIS